MTTIRSLRRPLALAAALSAALLTAFPAAAAGYGQGVHCDDQNRPLGALEFQSEYADCGAYALTDDPGAILLTFDQGYENGYTAQILDTLREKNVSAIFFLTGDYAKREPELVCRMRDEGHILGNHGMTHAAIPALSDDALETELRSLHDYVAANYGYEMQYFRPPCGEYDLRSLCKVQSLGYRTVFWSAAYVDWKPDDQPDPAQALATLTAKAHPGAIYLLHSVSATNAAILGDLIDSLRAQGYRL